MAQTPPWTRWLAVRDDVVDGWRSAVQLLGPDGAWAAVQQGHLALGHKRVAATSFAPATADALRRLAWLGRARLDDASLLFEGGLGPLTAATPWVQADDGVLEVDPFAASWFRAQGGQDDFVRVMDRLGASLRAHFRATLRLPFATYREAAERRLALDVDPVWVDLLDRGSVFQLFDDTERAWAHLARLEQWLGDREDATLRLVLARHRGRLAGHEDQAVSELQRLLPTLDGMAALEARVALTTALGRIGSREEAVAVAAAAPPPQGTEATLWVQLQAQAGRELAMGGDLEAADERLQQAARLALARGLTKMHDTVQGTLAMVALLRRDLDLAEARLEASAATIAASSPFNRKVHEAFRAVLALHRRDAEAARARFDALGPVEVRELEPALITCLAAGLAGHEPAHDRALALAMRHGHAEQQQLCRHLRGDGPAPTGWQVRPTLALLGRTVTARLDVAPDGTWFDLGQGRVSLSRSPLQARVLAGLAAAAEPLSTAALVEVGWPGEKIRPDAAANRLYVVLNGLRKAGLRDWIVRRAGGYSLRREA